TPPGRQMNRWLSALLSLCCRKTASSLRPSRWTRGAPPAPSSARSSSGQAPDLLSPQPPLDARHRETAHRHPLLRTPVPGLDRAVAAGHLHTVVVIRAEADRPEQTARRHLGVDLAAVVLDFHDVPATEVALELGCAAGQALVRSHVVAGDGLVGLEAPLLLRAPVQVHRR